MIQNIVYYSKLSEIKNTNYWRIFMRVKKKIERIIRTRMFYIARFAYSFFLFFKSLALAIAHFVYSSFSFSKPKGFINLEGFGTSDTVGSVRKYENHWKDFFH